MDPDTPKPGETVTPPAPTNDGKPQSTPPAPVVPPVKTEDSGEVEKLRKEKEQAEMRANQLANQLKAKDDAEAAAKAKELEEQNKFKDLFEQEKAKREALETERQEEEKRKELNEASKKVFADYSDEVKKLAEEAGMGLADTDESTINAFKEKLDKVAKMVNTSGKVGANNPNRPSGQTDLTPDELKVALSDEKSFHDLVTSRFPGIASMTSKRS